MKNLALVVRDFCAAAVGLVVWGTERTRSVNELADRLNIVGPNHHRVV
jgi:hypothetical protein